jgi:cytochrome c biogenesis protein
MTSPPDEMNAASLTTAPREESPAESAVTLPKLGGLGMLRWAWRQLTSMRIALILLFMLSLAAVPGSMLPQRSANTDPTTVTQYLADHTTVGPILDKLQLFEVYKSAWFSAIYLLLFVSLVGCIIPRSWAHAKVLRKPPPAAPRNLARMPAHRSWLEETASSGSVAGLASVPGSRLASGSAPGSDPVGAKLAAAEKALRAKRFRVVRGTDANGGGWVSGEKGYLREVGNLVFHLSLVGILVGFAVKGYFGYQGKVLVTEGSGFTNIVQNYDDKNFGGGVDTDRLPPFNVVLDKFDAQYESNPKSTDFGQPRGFQAHVSYTAARSSEKKQKTITLNNPLSVNGVNLYLVSHGYAPVIKVSDAAGRAVYDGPVQFFEAGAMFKSSGMLRIGSGLKGADGKPTELGIQGWFMPTMIGMSQTEGPVSAFPAAGNPVLLVNAYTGDLGVNASVFRFDTIRATQLQLNPDNKDITAAKLSLDPGKDTVQLPNGMGSITFEGVKQYAQFDINHDPSKKLVFGSAIGIVGGLLLSLGIRRRRVFVRVRPDDRAGSGGAGSRLRVEVAGLARAEDVRLAEEVEDVGRGLRPTQKTRTGSVEAGAGQ